MIKNILRRRNINIFDLLLITGFIFSISVMGLTVYYTSQHNIVMMDDITLGIKEDNGIMATMLGYGHHFTIFVLGVVWAGIFTAYYYLRKTMYGVQIAILAFCMFSFNLVHDVMVVIGTGL